MATPDNGIAALMYNSSEVTVKAGNLPGHYVTLEQITNYPFDEHIKIKVKTEQSVHFPIYLRVPGWCRTAAVAINGKPVEVMAVAGSYIRLENVWKNGDVIDLTLPMKVVLQKWVNNKNSVSVNYGPLTFSLKIREYYKKMDAKAAAEQDSKWQPSADQSKWPAYEIYPASMWNYGLSLSDRPLSQQFEVIKRPWPSDGFPFTQKGVPILIKAKGKLIPFWTTDQYGLCGVLPQSPVKVDTPEQPIELIPMGAARLRISSFPVVE